LSIKLRQKHLLVPASSYTSAVCSSACVNLACVWERVGVGNYSVAFKCQFFCTREAVRDMQTQLGDNHDQAIDFM
jgi:hypothetical protein